MIIIFHHFFATHNSLTHFRFSVVFSGFLKGFLGLVFRVSIKTQLKQKVKDSFEQSRTLIGTITGTATFECIANLPTCSFLFRTINRERTQDLVNPQTLGEKSVSLELQKTLRGENFLAYDSGSDDAERFLIFTTEENLDLLELNTVWHAYGTFKCCPTLFYQLFTIHGVINAQSFPLGYFLLQRKTEAQYSRALEQLKQENVCLEPREILVDFELASINAFKKSFPSAAIKGCFFHFAQANWRKIQELGLASVYKSDVAARSFLKCSINFAPSWALTLLLFLMWNISKMPGLEKQADLGGALTHCSPFPFGISMKML